MKQAIYKISDFVDRKPFHALFIILLVLNLSKIGNDPNYISLVAVAGLMLSAAISVLLKVLFKKKRPQHYSHRVIKYGFPSSHSQIAFSISTVYSYYAPNYAAILFSLAIFVAASRIITNAHGPKDVIGGSVFGILTGLAAVALMPAL